MEKLFKKDFGYKKTETSSLVCPKSPFDLFIMKKFTTIGRFYSTFTQRAGRTPA